MSKAASEVQTSAVSMVDLVPSPSQYVQDVRFIDLSIPIQADCVATPFDFLVTWDRLVSEGRYTNIAKWYAFHQDLGGGRCRRFICKKDGICREERGDCRKEGCGKCFEKIWKQGYPFIPESLQLKWIAEFLWMMSLNQAEAQKEVEPRGTDGKEEISKKIEPRGTDGKEEARVAKLEVGVKGIRRRMAKERASKEIKESELIIASGSTVQPGAEEETFGQQDMNFPTTRRPIDSQRRLYQDDIPAQWIKESGIHIGDHLLPKERERAIRLLYTWRDLFISEVDKLPATDLVVHTIPTYPNARPHVARIPIWAVDECKWQDKYLPAMMGVVIQPCTSPWSAKTTFVNKKDTIILPNGERSSMRMVHTFCQLNDATIKTNYPMKRQEPILEGLARPTRRYFFAADAAYGFYAVQVYPPHAYKTAFALATGQYCYIRMPMGLSGAPATYARLKDITFGPIPMPNAESSISNATFSGQLSFGYFFDDDYGASDTFNTLFDFLLNCYFPRLAWARLTLKPEKSQFFVPTIHPLGMVIGAHVVDKENKVVKYGLKAADPKIAKICDCSIPKCLEELDAFIY